MAAVLISGLAALWVFMALNMPSAPPPLPWIHRQIQRLPRGYTLATCPWCLGAWLSFAFYAVYTASAGVWDVVGTPLGALAAAGVTGTLGSLVGVPDDDEPTEG